MVVDFHTHSKNSDGIHEIEQLINKAYLKNVEHLSITDHDYCDWSLNAPFFEEKYGLKLHKGVEISCYDYVNHKKVHILGYCCQKTRNLERHITFMKNLRNESNFKAIDELIELGYMLDVEKYREISRNLTIYKSKILEDLIPNYKNTRAELSIKLKELRMEGLFKDDLSQISYRDGINLILEAGGIPILAHPGVYGNERILQDLVKSGIAGIEVFHPVHSKEKIEIYHNFAKKNNLLVTAGSDFHGYEENSQIGMEIDQEVIQPFLDVLNNHSNDFL